MNGKLTVIKCCECTKNIPADKVKKHPHNGNLDYCEACYSFWFK